METNEMMNNSVTGRKSKGYIPIFYDWVETTQDLTREEKGGLIDAMILYASGSDNWEEQLETSGIKIAFRFMRGQIDRYLAISEARSESGRKKKEQPASDDSKADHTGSSDNKIDQIETSVSKSDQTETNASYNNNNNNNNNNENKNKNKNKNENENKNENKNEKEKENESENKKRGRSFAPPTLEDVRAYCAERNNGIDPEYWMDYYAARNWVLSNGKKMSDWKAVIRTWEKNNLSRDRPREPVRTVSAQQYTQRDYADAEARAFRKLIEMGCEAG